MNRVLTVIILALVAMASATLAGNVIARSQIQADAAIPVAHAARCAQAEAPLTHTPEEGPSPYSDARPPKRFQGNAEIRARFVSSDQVTAACVAAGGDPPPCGMEWAACTTTPPHSAALSILPNPCEFPGESFAETVCHELAHVNGWPGSHGP